MRIYLKILFTLLIAVSNGLLSAEAWSGYVNLTKDYIVEEGEVLEIMPGTVVRTATGCRIIINGGVLLARGEDLYPIQFTSYEPESYGTDDWGGIEFYNANQDTSVIDFCIVENILKKDPERERGSIFTSNSLVKISNSIIQNNSAPFGGALETTDGYLYLFNNKILNNTVNFQGAAIYVCHANGPTKGDIPRTIISKNVIMNNKTDIIERPEFSSGGIFVFEDNMTESYTLIQENDIIANNCLSSGKASGGIGGGLQIRTQSKYLIDVIGNKIMYNRAESGGGLAVVFKSGGTYPHNYTNNIVANNTSYINGGGVYFDMDFLENPQDILFTNNNIINNDNTYAEIGAGGYYIEFNSDLGNYINVSNSIIWGNVQAGKADDFNSSPSIYPGAYLEYSNTTQYIEGRGNMDSLSLFYRTPDFAGAIPYENYLRSDYHLSLESPCVDAGDPKTPIIEADQEIVNIGAYGNTNEATPSVYKTTNYEQGLSISVKAGETYKLDCSRESKYLEFGEIIVEDGGQLFIKTSPESYDPNIYISSLVTQGKKIGDQYTTRIQRMTALQQSELPYNVLHITDMNCTGAEFNNMAVIVNSGKKSALYDSHVYVNEYNENLTGINLDSPDADINNNIVDNFGIGIYFGPTASKGGKASRTARIANNTINFDASEASKGTKAKGIVVEQSQDVEVENNNINNPNEGIEAAAASSGRISNNTVNFDVSEASKAGTLKKAIHIFDSSDWEVDHNRIYCNDALTTSISAIEVHDSSIDCNYNIIQFGTYDAKANDRFAFYTENLQEHPVAGSPVFINNTVYNSDMGFYDYGTTKDIRIFNNIFYGPTLSTYITASYQCLFLYNNDIAGNVDEGAIADEKNNISDDPWLQSSKSNDFYLWIESKCIDAGRYEPDYHIYGDTFYGDAPDIGAVEFWQESSFYAPQSISITASASIMTISWSSVPDAVSYNIYRAADPYGDFSFVKSTTSTNWSASTTGSTKYFYRVTASRDGEKSYNEAVQADINTKQVSAKPKKIIIKERESLK